MELCYLQKIKQSRLVDIKTSKNEYKWLSIFSNAIYLQKKNLALKEI